jgi:membrane protease YdiL (CAAX protease family)
MHTYLKNKPAWLQLVIFGALTIASFTIGSLIGLYIVVRINHLELGDLSQLSTLDFAKPEYAGVAKGMLIVQFFIFVLPCLIFAYLADPKPLAFAGLKKPDKKRFIFIGLAIILCSYLMVEWLGVVNQQLVKNLLGKSAQKWIEKGESSVNGTLQNILAMKNTTDLLVSVLLVGVLAAIGEELFFRGIMQRIFIQVFKSPWLGIILTAAIFSAVHGQFLGFIPRMVLGIILGALYWYSGSLLPAILGHFIFNSLQIVLVYYRVMSIDQQSTVSGKFLSVVGIASLVLVIALLNYLRKHSVTTYSRVYPTFDTGHKDEFVL